MIDSTLTGMDERALDPDPIRQFSTWYAEALASDLAQPDAAALATATEEGRPSVRMVLLKGHDQRGFAFYTNHDSRKSREMTANPHAALVFHWQPLHRQVRIEGTVERVSEEESAAYFATRPRGSQVAAWASPQSSVVASREDLDALYEQAAAQFDADEIRPPPFWGGYRIVPAAIEFWQGRENRFHDRIRYERTDRFWARVRLAP
jgi:pyridoxamine 5'-phosphate oxidase